MNIRRVNNSVLLHRLLFFILLLPFFVVNLTTWGPSTREMACEQFQTPCLDLFNGYNQADELLSNVSMPDCFQFCHPGIKISFPVPDFEDLPLSGPGTCKCSRAPRGETPSFRAGLPDSQQRPICFMLAIPLQGLSSETIVLWKKRISLRPPDHLKPLSTIILIV